MLVGLAIGCNALPLKLQAAPGPVDTAAAAGDRDDDGDGHTADEDCDDTDEAVFPGAAELCNGRDDNCDGQTDEGLPTAVWFRDIDGDGFGDLDGAVEACAEPPDHAANDWDCDDSDASINPSAPEPCGGGDRDCDGNEPDACASCLELRDAGVAAESGVYEVALETVGVVDVWCDMDTDGGGWTLVQRTVWDWAESGVLMTDYETWYRETRGSADEGRAFRLAGRAWGELSPSRELLIRATPRLAESGDDCGVLRYQGQEGRVLVSSHAAYMTGLVSDAPLLSSDALSTTDQGPATDCVSTHAVPWFYGGCCATCPTYQGGYWADSPHPMLSYGDDTPDALGNTVDTVCAADAERASSASFVGLNAMDVLLR